MINKIPYNKLSEFDRQNIIESYFKEKSLKFKSLSNLLGVSERALSRVLKEANINTKRINRYRLNEHFFKIINCEEKAYILGLLYADGYVGNEHFNNVVLQLVDEELIKKVASAFEFDGIIRKSKKGGFLNSKPGYVINLSSTIMANDLRKIGLYPKKSLSMENIPELDEKLFRHYIRGYFDGDGSIVLSKNSVYHTVNGRIKKYNYPTYCFQLLGTEKFLAKIAEKMELKHYLICNTKTDDIKQLRVSAKCDFLYLFNYLYGNSKIFMERKYNKWIEIKSAFMK